MTLNEFPGLSRPTMAALAALFLLLLLSFGLRQEQFKHTTGATNLEASYHALLTMRALKQVPASEHLYLPTVTLGAKNDKFVRWGATVPTPAGNYIYTSFAAPGFVAPYAVLSVLGAEFTPANLAYFNVALGALTSLLLFLLLHRLLAHTGASDASAAGGALAGCIISVLSMEALKSHGLVYWSHSLFQPIMAGGLYCLARYLMAPPDRHRERAKFASLLAACVFMGAWTEWTGYVFGAGAALIAARANGADRSARMAGVKLLGALCAAGALTMAHLAAAIGVVAARDAYMARFLARGTRTGTVDTLLLGYAQSYGVFLLLAGVAIAAVALRQRRAGPLAASQKHALLVLVAASVPMLENFLMLQHAGEFSFDRLKLIFPVSLCVAFAFAQAGGQWRAILAGALILASAEGYVRYAGELGAHAKWAEIDKSNQRLVAKIAASADAACAVWLSNLPVRGYANLLIGRAVYEHIPGDAAPGLLRASGACSAIYIEGVMPFRDLPAYTRAVITQTDGSTLEIRADDGAAPRR